MSNVQVYLRREELLIVPMKEMQSGGYIEFKKLCRLDMNAPPEVVGRAVLDELDQAGGEPLHVSSEDLRRTPVVQKAVGAKSWKEFYGGTRSCWIERCGSELRLVPMPPGRQRSFIFDTEHGRVLVDLDEKVIGREVLEVLKSLPVGS